MLFSSVSVSSHGDFITGMMGYGMAKAAVHQLVKSLGGANSGMPSGALTAAILPYVVSTFFILALSFHVLYM